MLATTTDIISRRRYIFMSMLPNIVLGIIPIILYFVAVNANCKISPNFMLWSSGNMLWNRRLLERA